MKNEKTIKTFTPEAEEAMKAIKPIDLIANRMSFKCFIVNAEGVKTEGVKTVALADLFCIEKVEEWKKIRKDLQDGLNVVHDACKFFGLELTKVQEDFIHDSLNRQFKIAAGSGMDTIAMASLINDGSICKTIQKAMNNDLQFTVWRTKADYKAAHTSVKKPVGKRVIDWTKKKGE